MEKIRLGDVFEIATDKGFAYFQCVELNTTDGELIKIFNKLHYEPQKDAREVVCTQDHYFSRFQFQKAKEEHKVTQIGYAPIDKDFRKPVFMKYKYIIRGEFIGWHIVNTETLQRKLVKELSDEQRVLSEFGLMTDTILKERLASGWTPRHSD